MREVRGGGGGGVMSFDKASWKNYGDQCCSAFLAVCIPSCPQPSASS